MDRSGRGILRLAGKDPVGMLNAILTNQVPKSRPRRLRPAPEPEGPRPGRPARPQERRRTSWSTPSRRASDAAKEILGRYAPFSRVKTRRPLRRAWGVLGLYGPRAGDLLERPRPRRARERGSRSRRRDAARRRRRGARCAATTSSARAKPVGARERAPPASRGGPREPRRLRDRPRGGRHSPLRCRHHARELPRPRPASSNAP